MEEHIVYDAQLTKADRLLLKTLAADVGSHTVVGHGAAQDGEARGAMQDREDIPSRKLIGSDESEQSAANPARSEQRG